jgi:phosphoglycolate phosphatase
MPEACILDLDGTLVNSLRDIGEALNHCLQLLGLPTHPLDRYRYMVGEGVPKLCQRALGNSRPDLVPRLVELLRPYYRTLALHHTAPYPGVEEMVGRMRAAGIKLAVLSNKPHDLTVRVVQAFWGNGAFEVIYGYLEEAHRKPSPKYLLRICAELGVSPARTWMIGDTPTDMQTAHAGGAIGVGVTWGFRTRRDLAAAGADRIVDEPGALP